MTVQKNALEWTVFAIAAVIVVACIGLLVHLTIESGDLPPELTVTTLAPRPAASGFVVPVRIRNDGDTTAEEVRVEVRLESAGGTVEQSEMTFAFVPRRSEREGAVVFSRDPRCCRIDARATSFEMP